MVHKIMSEEPYETLSKLSLGSHAQKTTKLQVFLMGLGDYFAIGILKCKFDSCQKHVKNNVVKLNMI
jgi:hypothetical protein